MWTHFWTLEQVPPYMQLSMGRLHSPSLLYFYLIQSPMDALLCNGLFELHALLSEYCRIVFNRPCRGHLRAPRRTPQCRPQTHDHWWNNEKGYLLLKIVKQLRKHQSIILNYIRLQKVAFWNYHQVIHYDPKRQVSSYRHSIPSFSQFYSNSCQEVFVEIALLGSHYKAFLINSIKHKLLYY